MQPLALKHLVKSKSHFFQYNTFCNCFCPKLQFMSDQKEIYILMVLCCSVIAYGFCNTSSLQCYFRKIEIKL